MAKQNIVCGSAQAHGFHSKNDTGFPIPDLAWFGPFVFLQSFLTNTLDLGAGVLEFKLQWRA
jgi:hypothetical protein